MHASHAALPMVTLKILPYINATLTSGWIWGIWVREPYTVKK
jgi:hypothetical protein